MKLVSNRSFYRLAAIILSLYLPTVTLQAENRVEYLSVASQQKDPFPNTCGVHAAKNCWALLKNRTALTKGVVQASNRSLTDIITQSRPASSPLRAQDANLSSEEIEKVLKDIFELWIPDTTCVVPQLDPNITIINEIQQFTPYRHQNNHTDINTLIDIYGLSMHQAQSKLQIPGQRHVFILGTGGYARNAQGEHLGRNGLPVQNNARMNQLQQYAGHWFTVEVENRQGNFIYRIADSSNGKPSIENLKWFLNPGSSPTAQEARQPITDTKKTQQKYNLTTTTIQAKPSLKSWLLSPFVTAWTKTRALMSWLVGSEEKQSAPKIKEIIHLHRIKEKADVSNDALIAKALQEEEDAASARQ